MENKSPQKHNKALQNKTIVCIGGGTGLFSLLSGLKTKVPNKNTIKAIVTTLDNGGSSGKLITQYGVLPPGDIRNCLVALSEETEVLNKLFQYRFDEKLDNHNFGNLIITALSDITGSFDEAVKVASKILRIKGEVIPVSLQKNDLVAQFSDKTEIVGESQITKKGKKITNLFLKNNSKPNKRTIEVIKKADLIVFGPGSLYTSILPNILFENLRNAINQNKTAKKILITGVMSQPGETDNFCASDFKCEIEKYLKGKITHIISNSYIPTAKALQKYKQEKKFPIPLDEQNIKNCKIIKGNLIDKNTLVRHNPQKLAEAIINLLL